MREYKLSILIPAWNGEKYIENCVRSILENDFRNFQIIIIAGGNDNSFQIAKEIETRYPQYIKSLQQTIPNKNKAANKGLKLIDGDIIVLTDIDCIYQKNWLRKINSIFQDSKHNVITGSTLPFPESHNSLAEYNRIFHGEGILRFEDSSIVIGNKLCGANAAFRKEIFLRKIGKFDETPKTGEDKILGIDFMNKGEDLYFFRHIYVFTECYSKNNKKFIKSQIRWARDLFISKLSIKQKIKVVLSLCLALFKLTYPIFVIIIALMMFNLSLILILITPWFLFYLVYLVNFYFKLNYYGKKVTNELYIKVKIKKAFKAVFYLYFFFALITVVAFIYPKRHKWYF